MIRLIDENQPNTPSDDRVISSTVLLPQSEVKLNSRPPDISTNPTEIMPVPIAQFKSSIYPSSLSHNVCPLRFLRNGTVVNEGTDSIGSGAFSTGKTIYVWSPKKDNAYESEIARAITVIGAIGSVRV